MQDLVSIILSTYNRANFLKHLSIPSVINQTYKNWELIVVDDGSNDDTKEVINFFKKKIPNLKYLRFENNRGYAATINEGFKLADGQFIALLDADDGWFSNKLERQVDFMKENNLLASTTYVVQYNVVKKKIDGIVGVGLPGFMAKKELFNYILPLDETLRGIEDGDFFCKIELAKMNNKIKENEIQILKEPLVFYTRHSGALSYYDIKKSEIMIERYNKFLDKYRFLIENKERITPTLSKLFFLSYVRLGIHQGILSDRRGEDRKSTRLNSSHSDSSRMAPSA
jgi:glycosyltransferase involved in cell wall biosynthesis